MSRGEFLCGCSPVQKKNYRHDLYGSGENAVLTNKRYDDAGYEICPDHGYRLYGWNSPIIQHAAGQEVLDYGRMGGNRKLKINSDTEDRRDNRDPVEDHDEILADWRNQKAARNGK